MSLFFQIFMAMSSSVSFALLCLFDRIKYQMMNLLFSIHHRIEILAFNLVFINDEPFKIALLWSLSLMILLVGMGYSLDSYISSSLISNFYQNKERKFDAIMDHDQYQNSNNEINSFPSHSSFHPINRDENDDIEHMMIKTRKDADMNENIISKKVSFMPLKGKFSSSFPIFNNSNLIINQKKGDGNDNQNRSLDQSKKFHGLSLILDSYHNYKGKKQFFLPGKKEKLFKRNNPFSFLFPLENPIFRATSPILILILIGHCFGTL